MKKWAKYIYRLWKVDKKLKYIYEYFSTSVAIMDIKTNTMVKYNLTLGGFYCYS
jgi:hypothetical protein